jgi:peptidoglycan/xylan/chitin deacetylase (PgdA/CDA1 family)
VTRPADLLHSEPAKRIYFTGLTQIGVPLALLGRRARQRALLVLSLHSVSDRNNPFWPSMHPHTFEALVRFLARNCTVTTFSRVADAEDGSGRPVVILSFDDGYLDFVEHAMPILARYELPANHNLIGECVETGEPPWIVQVCDQLSSVSLSRLQSVAIPNGRQRLMTGAGSSRERFGAQLTNYLKSLPRPDREAIWSEMVRALGEIEVKEPTRMMGRAEIRAAISAGHEIGMHSYSHESMELVDDREFVDDLCRARAIVADLGGAPSIYAFPNGSYRSNQIGILRRHGVEHVLLMGERPSAISARVHTRITVRGHHADEVVLRALGHRPPLIG